MLIVKIPQDELQRAIIRLGEPEVVGPPSTPVLFAPVMEKHYVPDKANLMRAIKMLD